MVNRLANGQPMSGGGDHRDRRSNLRIGDVVAVTAEFSRQAAPTAPRPPETPDQRLGGKASESPHRYLHSVNRTDTWVSRAAVRSLELTSRRSTTLSVATGRSSGRFHHSVTVAGRP